MTHKCARVERRHATTLSYLRTVAQVKNLRKRIQSLTAVMKVPRFCLAIRHAVPTPGTSGAYYFTAQS